jgi:signal transduction histidine kinase
MSAMNLKKWTEYFLPSDEERDPAFREELSRLAAIGLRAIGCICLFAPILVFASVSVVRPAGLSPSSILWRTLALIIIGAVVTPLSFIASLRPFARLLGTLTGYTIAMTLILSSIAISRDFPEEDHHLPGHIALVMLVGMAVLPAKPIQTLALGLSIAASYLGTQLLVPPSARLPGSDPFHLINNLVVTFICTGLTAVLYAQRSSAYRARQQVQQSFEDLRAAQARLLLNETAASQGRLAAVLSHELNSPIGTLRSTVESLVLLYKKKRESDESRLVGIFEGLAHTALESCQRLREVVARMQRFTNLDRAEEQAVDLNELLRDTIGLLQSELNRNAQVALDLKPLPPLKCKPQQLSAVFLNLLRNALAQLQEKGTICVTSTQAGDEIAIQVRDNGPGIPAERLPSLFEPTFAVRSGKVTTSNWGLFTSRRIIVEHGGQIKIDSAEGKGTTVTVTLPAAAGATAS